MVFYQKYWIEKFMVAQGFDITYQDNVSAMII